MIRYDPLLPLRHSSLLHTVAFHTNVFSSQLRSLPFFIQVPCILSGIIPRFRHLSSLISQYQIWRGFRYLPRRAKDDLDIQYSFSPDANNCLKRFSSRSSLYLSFFSYQMKTHATNLRCLPLPAYSLYRIYSIKIA